MGLLFFIPVYNFNVSSHNSSDNKEGFISRKSGGKCSGGMLAGQGGVGGAGISCGGDNCHGRNCL